MVPRYAEQQQIGAFFKQLDHLITLHQRKCVFLFGLFQAFISMIFTASTFSWEQRKVGDLLIERNQQAPMSDEYPLMAFTANEGVAPEGERYDRSSLVTDTVNKLYKKETRVYSELSRWQEEDKMKTGLVLEGGALRTIFSSGACDGLLAGNVMTDYVIGVSAGIAYGVSYVSRQRGRNLEILTRYVNDRRYMGMGNLLRKDNRSYFGLKFTYDTIPNELVPFDYETFAAYPGEVEAVVTNLETGKAEYFPVSREHGDFKLLQATCALPLMFPIYDIEGHPCMDGGAADAIPFRRAFEKGCDKAIVILTRPRDYIRRTEKLQKAIERHYRQYPNFCQTMRDRAETYNRDREELFRLEREGKVLVIAPEDTRGVSRIERNVEKLRLLWSDGFQQATGRMEEIRQFMAD